MECALFRKDYDFDFPNDTNLDTVQCYFMECALFRKDYDKEGEYQELSYFSFPTLWNVPCLERITTTVVVFNKGLSGIGFMECALFRKDYDNDKTVVVTVYLPNLSLWNVPCLERITTSSTNLVMSNVTSLPLWNVPCLERITTSRAAV